MHTTLTAPRINAGRFSRYVNHAVRVPGKIIGVRCRQTHNFELTVL